MCCVIVCELIFHYSWTSTRQNVGDHCSRCLAPFTDFIAVYSKIGVLALLCKFPLNLWMPLNSVVLEYV